jgi:hypothetical protein
MGGWEYKSLVYVIKGKFFSAQGYWAEPTVNKDAPGRQYGPTIRTGTAGFLHQVMHQLEIALAELDNEGWELVSTSVSVSTLGLNGAAMLRRPRSQ